MGYISKQDFEQAVSVLTNKGFNSSDTSAIVYFMALSKIIKEEQSQDINLDRNSPQREKFIQNILSLIEIDSIHTWNPLAISDSANWNKNKSTESVIGSNLLTRQYADKAPEYPRTSPLLDFSNGVANLHYNANTNLSKLLNKLDQEATISLAIWLLRTHKFNEEEIDLFNLFNTISAVYGCQIPIKDEKLTNMFDTSSPQPADISIVLQYAKKTQKKRRVETISNSLLSLSLPKPFLLLAGISGTGKSRFVREQTKFHPQNDNFCLVAVRPDWHEPSDLLGYTSRLSGEAEYVATDVLRFLVAAWKSLLQTGVELDGDGERTSLAGDNNRIDAATPYWLCLDEMNLAPVEQYFADYLSLIETREWNWKNDNFIYSCDALLKPSALQNLKEGQQMALASELGLESEDEANADYDLWQHFLNHGIAIPPNLIVAGTVNMDETTHGFSRKVIDRAMSFDFGEFFPNDFDDFLEGQIQHAQLTFPRHSSGKDAIVKDDAMPSIGFLKAVNSVLKGSPFELAYRALNELLLAVHCHTPQDQTGLQAVWDDFLMQKVLPRIEGDADKVQARDKDNLLTHLQAVLAVQLGDIWQEGKTRTDFYRYTVDYDGQPVAESIPCRSREKLKWMLKRLENSGFTSFWP